MHDENDNTEDDKMSTGVDDISDNAINDIISAEIPPEIENNELAGGVDIENAHSVEQFDPDIHAVDKDGNPVLTKTGKFRKKRGVSITKIKEKRKEQEIAQRCERNSRIAGECASTMFFTVGTSIFGDEWQPQKIDGFGDEKEHLTVAFTEYFNTKEIKDFPAGVSLAFAMMVIAGRRLNKPVTRSKLQVIKEKLIILALRVKNKLKKGKINHGSHSGGRSDAIGQNEFNKTDSEKSKR